FSSRRRHTRSKRDWSSDVCSSDLSRTKNSSRQRCRLVPPSGASSSATCCLMQQHQLSPTQPWLWVHSSSPRQPCTSWALVYRRQIGRASCRERVEIWVVDVAVCCR